MSLQNMMSTPQAFHIQEQTNLDFLDNVYSGLLSGDIDAAMYELGERLFDLYTFTTAGEWNYSVRNYLLTHPLHQLLMQDPHTARSFNKPRGYSGDAIMLDMVYFPYKFDLSSASKIGRELFRFNTRSNIARSLRKRLSIISRFIDESSQQTKLPRILSVGCGHCREMEYSEVLKNRMFKSFVGIDQDAESLSEAERLYGAKGLLTKKMPISNIVKGAIDLGKFDIIICAGLYDYLGGRTAKRLTTNLYNMLDEGGKLFIANISQNFPEIGYFESYMNWSMICRNDSDILELASEIFQNKNTAPSIATGYSINDHYETLEIIKK